MEIAAGHHDDGGDDDDNDRLTSIDESPAVDIFRQISLLVLTFNSWTTPVVYAMFNARLRRQVYMGDNGRIATRFGSARAAFFESNYLHGHSAVDQGRV